MRSDEQLKKVSFEIDDILARLCLDNEMGPLVLSSIVLARLTLLNDFTGSGQDFRSLAESIIDSPIQKLPDELTTKVH
jgi:hypothetical protein